MDKSIHVILGIDMETDCGHNTPFYEGVQKATPVLLILEKKRVKRPSISHVRRRAAESGECGAGARLRP